jgi:hypothetical protein
MAFHLRGTVLPDRVVRDLWLLGDRITFQRPAGPVDTLTDGGFLLPGLVDVHTHPGTDEEAGTLGFDPGLFAEQIAAHRDAGTTALRFPGLLGEVPAALRDAPGSPRMITAGRWLAWAGLSSSAPFHTVTDDLAAAAVAEAKSHDGWCKLMGDPHLPGPEQPGRGRPRGRHGLRRRPLPRTGRPAPSPSHRAARPGRALTTTQVCGHGHFAISGPS